MTSQGIYTLANDVVYDQLVALLNSIERNVSPDIPICVIPYDDRIDKIKLEIDHRPNVTLFENQESIQRWEDFAHKIWNSHPMAKSKNLSRSQWYKGHLQRKFVAFDGDFEHFVFYEADNLAMKSINDIFDKLREYDFVFDDWEHRKSKPVAALNIDLIESSGLYKEADIRAKIHDASFWGSKKGFFDAEELNNLQQKLIDEGEVNWINGYGFWDDVFLFNYLTFRCDRPIYNFTLSENAQERTGNCADADPFVNIDNVLYNEQGLKPIHRLHYMNYSSADFASLTQGYDANIRYKDEFLYYRFWKNPDQKPQQLKPLSLFHQVKKKIQLLNKKLKKLF